ncbi:hypothetical protein [Carnobacterium inhibens]|uniref:Uncharacterized protein n=1 Tax=Carnobacterium inhibens subsp. gilichinskyi TaxID=1266845 RepID=U5S7D9_9LACT|nr:hypothetical protein [Carnobacterium inhibens]AGY81100.1 hypothetical protein Q783_01870 [Carnobacterium inhibens subsp. gilichinskyi]
MKKITSKNNNTYLFQDVPHTGRNSLGIASGKSVLLSIFEGESYNITEDVNLIHYSEILKEEVPTDLENEFFSILKKNKQVKYKKALIDKYQLGNYVHYLPKVKYTQEIVGEKLIIKGNIIYVKSMYKIEAPTVKLDDIILPLESDNTFIYSMDIPTEETKLDFILELTKQIITKSYKVKI